MYLGAHICDFSTKYPNSDKFLDCMAVEEMLSTKQIPQESYQNTIANCSGNGMRRRGEVYIFIFVLV